MKEKTNINELLSGYIDGELDERQTTEVQRLIAHDPKVAERLREMQQYSTLIGSLPIAEAPAEMLEDIKTRLERNSLLSPDTETYHHKKGSRHLFVRRLIEAAAMIALVAALATVVYTIVVPNAVTDEPIALDDWTGPVEKVEPIKQAPVLLAKIAQPKQKFAGKLEIKTSDPVAVNAFFNKAIQANTLLSTVGPRQNGGQAAFALVGSSQALNLLLTEVQNIWQRFDSAKFSILPEADANPVVVENIKAEQLIAIINSEDAEQQTKIAKDFAALNSIDGLWGQTLFATNSDKAEIFTIPKPVLTSSKKEIKTPAEEIKDSEKIDLTIVITAVPK
ncbi:MAG: anti-sigma factor family protein [Planctomycetota bacterium]|jgi:hypothetical protein